MAEFNALTSQTWCSNSNPREEAWLVLQWCILRHWGCDPQPYGVAILWAFTFLAASTINFAKAAFFMTSLRVKDWDGVTTADSHALPVRGANASSLVLFSVSLFCDREATVWYSFIVRLNASARKRGWRLCGCGIRDCAGRRDSGEGDTHHYVR